MKLAEKLITAYLGRLSREEKDALFLKAVDEFFRDMTPQQKQQLIEQALTRLFDNVEMKDFLPRFMAILWKNISSEEDRQGILDRMTKMASDTGGKLADILPSRIKKML